MMSTARVSAFLASFVLPSIAALAPEKSRPASRQLVTVLTTLGRNRPDECIHSLVMPTLMGKARELLISGETSNEVSKAQCELITVSSRVTAFQYMNCQSLSNSRFQSSGLSCQWVS